MSGYGLSGGVDAYRCDVVDAEPVLCNTAIDKLVAGVVQGVLDLGW
jgi:hypothetical protein